LRPKAETWGWEFTLCQPQLHFHMYVHMYIMRQKSSKPSELDVSSIHSCFKKISYHALCKLLKLNKNSVSWPHQVAVTLWVFFVFYYIMKTFTKYAVKSAKGQGQKLIPEVKTMQAFWTSLLHDENVGNILYCASPRSRPKAETWGWEFTYVCTYVHYDVVKMIQAFSRCFTFIDTSKECHIMTCASYWNWEYKFCVLISSSCCNFVSLFVFYYITEMFTKYDVMSAKDQGQKLRHEAKTMQAFRTSWFHWHFKIIS
jgi:hypothetical protein